MKKPTKKVVAAALATFTPEELGVIHDAVQAVWQQIGYDCIAPYGEDDPENPPRTMRRSEVIEVALDAGRTEQEIREAGRRAALKLAVVCADGPHEYEQRVRRDERPPTVCGVCGSRKIRVGPSTGIDFDALATRFDALDYPVMIEIVKPAFPFERYGLYE